MKKYEYTFLTYDDLHLIEAIDHCNKLGKEGWELISHSVYCDLYVTDECNVCHYYYFKREII